MEVFVLSQTVTDNTLPILYRDQLFVGANNGVKFLADLAASYSWPKQAAPVNGDAVMNLNESGNNGSVIVGANGAPVYAGRGFDFSTVTATGEYVQDDGGFASSIGGTAGTQVATATATVSGGAVTGYTVTNGGGPYSSPPPVTVRGGGGAGATGTAVLTNGVVTGITLGAGGNGFTGAPIVDIAGPGNQYFMATMYLRLPAQADWPTTGGVAALTFSQSSSRYTSVPEIIEVTPFGQAGGARYLVANRQTSIGNIAQLNMPAVASDYGALAQVAYWRNAAGTGFRLKTASRVNKTTAAVGPNNTASFAGLKGRFGLPPTTSLTGTNNNFRLYRMALEDLSISGRDPETVLDADWARTIARGVFS
jgi:hypothetical protein